MKEWVGHYLYVTWFDSWVKVLSSKVVRGRSKYRRLKLNHSIHYQKFSFPLQHSSVIWLWLCLHSVIYLWLWVVPLVWLSWRCQLAPQHIKYQITECALDTDLWRSSFCFVLAAFKRQKWIGRCYCLQALVLLVWSCNGFEWAVVHFLLFISVKILEDTVSNSARY